MEIKTKFNIGDDVYFKFGIGNDRYYAERVKDEICNYTVGWAKYGKIVAIHIKDRKICYEMEGLIACIPESDIISDKKQAALDDIADRIGELQKSIKVLKKVRERIKKMEDF